MKTILNILLFTLSYSLFAQAPNKNWEKVMELDDQYVFVDTTNIKQIENQISSIGLFIYKTPLVDSKNNKETFAIKSNFIFETASKKYTVIGKLFYDKNWKIVGESSAPGSSINTALFGLLIDTSKVISSIYNKCVDYLEKNSNVHKPSDKNKNVVKSNSNSITEKKVTEDTSKNTRELLTEKFIDKKLAEESKTEKNSEKPKIIQPVNSSGTGNNVVSEYEVSSDKNVRGTIFTDGKKYSFQVSAWKNKSQAEAEVKRLISKGHNAFLLEVYLPNKGGTWYRVRIGYFDSIAELEKYRRNMY